MIRKLFYGEGHRYRGTLSFSWEVAYSIEGASAKTLNFTNIYQQYIVFTPIGSLHYLFFVTCLEPLTQLFVKPAIMSQDRHISSIYEVR